MGIFSSRLTTYQAGLAALLLASLTLRLYRLDAPVVDGFWAKQVAIANKARAMAGPPMTLLAGSYDFLPADGKRVPFTEEIPLYHGLLAGGYRLFGEQDWFGRVLSSIGSLVAITAFCGLMRREFDARFAIVSGLLFACTPLLLFYGRAVLADAWMLAGMLLAAYCYRRFLDAEQHAWLLAAGLAALGAALFKYYGLMVFLPIAEMACRRYGVRGLMRYTFWLPVLMAGVPVACWMVLIFAQTANPARDGFYFIFQQPQILIQGKFWTRFVDRTLVKSCGPILVGLMAVGGYALVVDRSRRTGPIVSWTVMGLFFYLLLAPKSIGHEYYAMMLLPAAAMWGGLGWTRLFGRGGNSSRSVAWTGALVLAAAVVLHSPFVMRGRFRLHRGMVEAGQRLGTLCSPTGRIAAGPMTPTPIIHYAQREGWLWEQTPLLDWKSVLAHYQALGAEYVVLYFAGDTPLKNEPCYVAMRNALPVVEHQSHAGDSDEVAYEYLILRLDKRAANW